MKVQILDNIFKVQFIKDNVMIKYRKYNQDGSSKIRKGIRIDTHCKICVNNNIIAVGKSSCNPLDKYDHIKGKSLAMDRALRSINFIKNEIINSLNNDGIDIKSIRLEFWSIFDKEFKV